MLQVSQIAAGMNAIMLQNANAAIARGENNVYIGNEGQDKVANYTDNSVIFTGAGEDAVVSIANGVEINTGEGASQVYIQGDNNSYTGGNDIDSVYIEGNGNSANMGDGDNQLTMVGNSNSATAGSGNDTVMIQGDNNSANMGDGDNQMGVVGNNNNITAGSGNDAVMIQGNGNSADMGDGDNQIGVIGDNNNIAAGSGNDSLIMQGNGNTANLGDGTNQASITGDNNNITTGAGNDTVMIQGNGNTASTGAGADNAIAIGDSNTLASSGGSSEFIAIGDHNTLSGTGGTNHFVYWGDYTKIRGGGGAFTLETLDKALNRGYFAGLGLERYLDQDKTVEQQLIGTSSQRIVLDGGVDLDAIAEAYHLSNEEKAILQDLYDRGELSKTRSDGTPLYTIEKSVKKSSPGNDVFVIGIRDNDDKHTRAVSDGECIASTVDWTTAMSVEQTVADQVTTTFRDKITLNGCDYTDVQLGDCTSLYADLTLTTENQHLNFQVGDVSGGYFTNFDKGTISFTNPYQETNIENQHQELASMFYSAFTRTSPLIIDFNQDGNVSAAVGRGVDLNNDGIADGAATNGDKMLAMSDLNGNGKIDGAEVFGDQTINPFTGEKINAANGFEALKEIAKSAEAYTGIKCLNSDGDVNLQALKEALATKGINLGFISDDNNTQLEELSKVESINVNNYTSQKESGYVQHNQLGFARFLDGSIAKTDDVWFKVS